MTEKSRTEYSAGSKIAVLSGIIAIVTGYAVSIVLMHMLVGSYAGAGGSFTVIMYVSAVLVPTVCIPVTYALYKRTAGHDTETPISAPPQMERGDKLSPLLDDTDSALLALLKGALTEKTPELPREFTVEEWDTILQRADRHAVLSVMYDTLMKQPLAPRQLERVEKRSRKVVLQNYRLAFLTHQVTELLRKNGITAVVLKGVTAAANFPTPELRKSGDIDILLPHEQQLLQARDVLTEAGFAVSETQLAHHHLVMDYKDGIELELHTMLAEPFDNAKINNYLEGCLQYIPDRVQMRNVMGYEYPSLSDGYQAYELLLHMLQHFLRAGFGLKLLCDWFFFWDRQVAEDEIALYLRLVEESGLAGFSMMITSLCVSCLGLDGDCGLCRHIGDLMDDAEALGFMKDILEAEEFGKSGKDRMVTMRGSHLWDYVREFHHMMNLNFPRAGKIFLLWPVLWCVTLFRFLRNNRRIRGVTASEVIKKAGERSRRMEKLELFRTKSSRR